MSNLEDGISEQQLHRERFIKYSFVRVHQCSLWIGVGVSVALFPAVYFLWRSSGQPRRIPWSSARMKSSPPPRRIASRPSIALTESRALPGPMKSPGFSLLLNGHKIDEEDSPFPFSWSDVSRSTAWHTFKAFGLATLGVVAFAGTSVSLLVWKWDVQDMQEFHNKMRLHVSSMLPSLSSTVHRPIASNTKVEGTDMESSSLASSIKEDDIDSWAWDAAKQRINEAYDRGGAPAWLAAVARELELERLQLLRRRQESDHRRSSQ